MTTPPAEQVAAFYAAAHAGLGLLHRLGLQSDPFDADHQALWQGIGGHLTAVDRIDLVLADAAIKWPLAFAPTHVFAVAGVAADEAQPPLWPGVDANLAIRMSQGLPQAVDAASYGGTLAQQVATLMATAWPSEPRRGDTGPSDTGRGEASAGSFAELQSAGPAATLLVGGGGALAAVVAYVAETDGLDLGRQVILVTDAPALRQWLGLAAAALGSQETPRVVKPEHAASTIEQASRANATVLLSQDASAPVRQALSGALAQPQLGVRASPQR